MKKMFTLLFVLCTAVLFAHTPLLLVEDNGDGTLYAEAGFSDGSGAQGMTCRLEDEDGGVIWEGKFDDFSSVEVDIPDISKYFVIFDGGPGHVVKKDGPLKAVQIKASESVDPNTAPAIKPTTAPEKAPGQPAVVQAAPIVNPQSYYPVREYSNSNTQSKDYSTQLTLITIFLGITALCMVFIVFILIMIALRQKT